MTTQLQKYRRLKLYRCRSCTGRHNHFVPKNKLCVTRFDQVFSGLLDEVWEAQPRGDEFKLIYSGKLTCT